MEEGVIGGLAGFTLAGGFEPKTPAVKMVAGTYAGHKLQQYMNKSKPPKMQDQPEIKPGKEEKTDKED